MKATILTIGDELLIGQVINTNAAFIAERLNEVGIEVVRMLTVGDNEQEIAQGLRESFEQFDMTVITGGLGPTHDDVTKKTLCAFFQTDLISSEEVRKDIESFLQSRNHGWSDAAQEQTLVPRTCTIIPNHKGTAPGELFEKDGKYVIAMPGVPYEMMTMMTEFVVPFFRQKSVNQFVIHRTLRTASIAESVLANKLGNIEEILQGARLAFLPSSTGVRLRITTVDVNRERAQQRIADAEARIRAKVEKFVYGVGDEELEDVVGKILTERKLTISVAESCTGGLIAHRFTNVPGSSHYFERGVITYSNESKIQLLSVPQEVIKQHGAVSREVAEAMARGVRENSRTNIGLSTTGIAGPTGGTPDKPVGLVWIGYADGTSSLAMKFNLGSDRVRIKERAAQAALELLRRKLLKIEE